jgi:hypothetical protein
MTEEKELRTSPPRGLRIWLIIHEQAQTLAAAPKALVKKKGRLRVRIPAIGTIALRLQAWRQADQTWPYVKTNDTSASPTPAILEALRPPSKLILGLKQSG